MMMPPMKVTHKAAPKAVAKLRRWASLRYVEIAVADSDFDRNVSGENITPTAKKATAVKNRVSQPIFDSVEFSLSLSFSVSHTHTLFALCFACSAVLLALPMDNKEAILSSTWLLERR